MALPNIRVSYVAGLAVLILGFCCLQRLLDGRHLPAQRRQLLVQGIDLCQRFTGQTFLIVQRFGQRRRARLRLFGFIILGAQQASKPGVFRAQAGERGLERCHFIAS